MLDVVFMGTPDFSVAPLLALYESGFRIKLVVTMPDKPRGRGQELSFSPVKETALRLGLPVYQPVSLKSEEARLRLEECRADVFIVVAYGKILPGRLLALPPMGCINLHASLLPSYRGAAPVQWAIINGEEKSGITTMQMDEGLDTGDILRSYPLTLAKGETGATLFAKLSHLAGTAVIDTLQGLLEGEIVPQRQPETDTAYAAMLTKKDGALDFDDTVHSLERRIRGLFPWPGSFGYVEGRMLKILEALPYPGGREQKSLPHSLMDTGQRTGTLLVQDSRLFVVCADGLLEILRLQPEAPRSMPAPSRGLPPPSPPLPPEV